MAKTQLANFKKEKLVWMATHKCQHHHTYLSHPKCYQEEQPQRIGFLDLECSHLSADIGIILSWAILRDEDDVILRDCITLSDIMKSDKDLFNDKVVHKGTEDKRIVHSLMDALKDFDRIVGYYSTGFDVPFARTRSVITGEDFPDYGTIYHSDAYYTVKFKFKLLSNKQENAARALLGTTEKTRISWPLWRAAARGNKKALEYVVEHNDADVRDLKRVYYVGVPFKQAQNRSM
jgi:uncharacterized protein YprB with RNaseH-like and TPR domain